MLRKSRIFIAALFFIGLTLLFLGCSPDILGWMADIQLLPSVLRLVGSFTVLNLGVVALILAVTLLFGRIYCSTLCPLGTLQDLSLRLRNLLGRRSRREKSFAFTKERPLLRYGVLLMVLVAMFTGVQVLVALVAPYSMYGRIVRSFVTVGGGATVPLLAIGFGSFVLIAVLSASFGRFWCGNICPVGTFLGLFSRHSLFRIRIDGEKCVKCSSCERICRASCIDAASGTVDSSRCVACFDCVDGCRVGAVSYAPPRKVVAGDDAAVDASRRRFLATGAVLLGAGVAARAQGPGWSVPSAPKPEAGFQRPVPAGAGSMEHFYDTCTACQLCVQACPNGVLKPSADIGHLLQPRMEFDRGWCRPECSACAEVCPTGALLPLAPGEKTTVRIGRALVDSARCIACGSCAGCPSGAIRLDFGNGRGTAVVDEGKCIGCGYCENSCPVSAIQVHGFAIHSK